MDALLPTLLEKSGQAKERFRVAIRALLTKIPLLCSYAKYSPLLLQVSFEILVDYTCALARFLHILVGHVSFSCLYDEEIPKNLHFLRICFECKMLAR